MTTRFINQRELFNLNNVGSIHIVGVGAIGSFVALALGKMGCKNLTIWDPDKLEDHNFANQMYPISALNKRKVEACSEMVRDFSGEIVTAKYGKFSNSSYTDIVICCVDSMETRKAIFNSWKNRSHGIFIDARMGGQFYRIYAIKNNWTGRYEEYERTLYSDENAVQERCGSKSIIYTVMGVAADVCNIVRRKAMGLEYQFETIKNYDLPEVVAPMEVM